MMQIVLPFHWRRSHHMTWNNCLQIMASSCAMSSNCVWLQIIFSSCINKTMPFSFLRSLLCEKDTLLHFPKIFMKKQTWWLNNKQIIELDYCKILWFVSVKYRKISWFVRSIIKIIIIMEIYLWFLRSLTNHDIVLNLTEVIQLLVPLKFNQH